MKYLIILLFSMLFLLGCNKKTASGTRCNNGNLDSIKVYYYNYSFISPLNMKCSDIKNSKSMPLENSTFDYEGVISKVIEDCNVLMDIEKEIQQQQPRNFIASKDARILCILYHKDGTTSELCLCQDSDVKYIYINGVLQNFNFPLVYLIKKNSGYYEWFTEKEKLGFEELNYCEHF